MKLYWNSGLFKCLTIHNPEISTYNFNVKADKAQNLLTILNAIILRGGTIFILDNCDVTLFSKLRQNLKDQFCNGIILCRF